MLNDNEDLPSAGTDPFSSPPEQKAGARPGSRMGWVLVLFGGLASVCGCATGFLATSVQLEAQEDWEGFYAFMSLCPLPCVVAGIILVIAGALPLFRRRQIENSQDNPPSH